MEKESFFRIIAKAFFKSFFVVMGIFAALIPLGLMFSSQEEVAMKKSFTTLIHPDHLGHKALLPSSKVILKINIHDVIGKGTLKTSQIHSLLTESREGNFFKNDRVKGILLCFNTPGGTDIDSDGIYRLMKEYKELYKVPIYGYVDGLCASGGVYIACACDKIYTTPMSIIGSVGVLMGPFFNVSDTLQKIGIISKTLTRGMDKDMMNPFKKWSDTEDVSLQPIMDSHYKRFVSIVSKARPKLTEELLINTLGAHVYDAEKAFELGFTDGTASSYNQVLKELAEVAIGKHQSYQVVELTRKPLWLMDFLSASTQFLSGKTFQEVLTPSKTEELFYYLYPQGVQGLR